MPYQFRQTGAEIQDILDQVGENTGDIAQNASDIAALNSNLTQTNATVADLNSHAARVAYAGWATSFTFRVGYGGILLVNGGGSAFSFWWPAGTFRAVSLWGDAVDAYTWSYTAPNVTVTASGYKTWQFIGY